MKTSMLIFLGGGWLVIANGDVAQNSEFRQGWRNSPAANGPAKDAKAMGEIRRFEYAGYIRQVAFAPDGKLIATDHQVWEAATGKKVATLPVPAFDDEKPFRLAFSPDSQRVAIHRYHDLVLVEAATGKEVWRTEHRPRGEVFNHVPRLAFTPDGKHLLTTRNDEATARVLSVATGKEIRRFEIDTFKGGRLGTMVYSFLVSKDGKRVVAHTRSKGDPGGPVVLDLETGKELHRYSISSEEEWFSNSDPSPDGLHFAHSLKNAVHLMDLKTGKEVRKFEADGKSRYVALSPDGKHVAASVRAAGRDDDWVQCWEMATGKSVRMFKGHTGTITSLVFSPDGEHILSGGADKTARLWRLKK